MVQLYRTGLRAQQFSSEKMEQNEWDEGRVCYQLIAKASSERGLYDYGHAGIPCWTDDCVVVSVVLC